MRLDVLTHGRKFLLFWVLARFPLLVILLYLFRDFLLENIGVYQGQVLFSGIMLLSTYQERILIFGMIALVLSVSVFLSRTLRNKKIAYLLSLSISLGFLLIIFSWLSAKDTKPLNVPIKAFLLTALLAINIGPDSQIIRFITAGKGMKLADLIFGVGVGLTEVLLPRPFMLWFLTRFKGSQIIVRGIWRWILDLLPVILVSLLAVLTLRDQPLVDLGRKLHPDSAVQLIDTQLITKGDVNVLALNKESKQLYASGRGLNHILAYQINALNQTPRQSSVETGHDQGLFYNEKDREIYVHNVERKAILILDSDTLNLIRSIPISEISPGDTWLVLDRFSNNFIIASEADERIHKPFIVVNRASGKLVSSSDLYPSFIFLNPHKPLLYMNFFRRLSELMAFDTQRNQVVRKIDTDKQVDRMVFVSSTNEVLQTSPSKSRILRHDADTLEVKGSFKTVLGVRGIAVDASRNLVLSASLVTNMLEVLDLKTGKHLAEYRLGPWLREICLDTEAGIAYVSSNGALYRVEYTSRL